jgi:hypothetical protein
MANISKMPPRRLALWSATSLTFITNVSLIAVLGLVAAEFSPTHPGPLAMASTAAALQGVSVILLATMACREANVTVPTTMAESNQLRSRRLTDMLANSIAMTVSCGMSLAAIGWLCSSQHQLTPIANLPPMTLVIAGLVLVVLVILFESLALTLLVVDSKESSSIVMLPPAEMIEARAHWSDGESAQEPEVPSFAVVREIPDPPKTADSSTISFRSSITGSTRLGSSKNRPGSSRPSSSSQNSQFDTWDTSTVPPPLRDTVHSRITTILPPIPGSRPTSPAKALDGPFLPDSPHPSQVALDLPSRATASEQFYSPPTSPRSPLHSSVSMESIPKRHFSPPVIPDSTDSLPLQHTHSQTSLAESVSHLTSRRLTTSPSEENIHPLFRASSATPPPSASAGTVLTAASIEEALGKRLNTSAAEALRGRPLVERNATSGMSTRSSTRSRPRAATARSEATSPLASHDSWLVPEAEEPPSPERHPAPAVPPRNVGRASTASPVPQPEQDTEPFPEYTLAATADPQYAAFNRAASVRR